MNTETHIARSSLTVAGMLALALTASPTLALEPPTYHATLLDDMVETVFPGVEFPNSWSTGLNENGDLIGQAMLNFDPDYGSRMQAFVYTVEHGVVALPLAGSWGSNAVTDVTERDENGEIIIVGGGVIGPSLDVSIGEAAIWRYSTVTGEVLETRLLGIPAGFDDSIAVAVNNSGTVVGFSSLTGPFTNWKYDIATDTLETFDFPARVTDLNNVGQVCGDVYRGDLFGNYEDLTDPYEPGDVMPQWAIDAGGISASWNQINDQGWLVGRAPTGISDGAGHFFFAIVRYADPLGWVGFDPVSHLSLAGGINDQGDFTNASGGVYLEDMGETFGLYEFVAPEWQQLLDVSESPAINDNRQVIGGDNHVWLLTPIGEMIIPGDVNGDVSVDLDDHCAWLANPIDLDGDGDADADDEQWLLDRLLVFGYTVQDCNGNGTDDHCDILSGLSLDCDGNDVPDECQPDCNGDGVPDACEPDCNGNGVPDPCDIADYTSMDCNENGIPDECDGGVVGETMQIFDPPLQLVPESVLTNDLLVTDEGIVGDVDFTLDLRYRIGYLGVELSHNGTTITLIDRPGHPEVFLGNGQLGYDIILDDEGTGGAIEDQGNFGQPVEPIVSPPSYTPDDPLSAFDGMPIEGVWTVAIITYSSSPQHEFNDWGLTITSAGVPIGICDCNDNGIADDVDIANGTSADGNGNGVPDECEGTPGDATGDGIVDVADLLVVLGAWGTTDPAADVNGDGVVDVQDILMVLANWG